MQARGLVASEIVFLDQNTSFACWLVFYIASRELELEQHDCANKQQRGTRSILANAQIDIVKRAVAQHRHVEQRQANEGA